MVKTVSKLTAEMGVSSDKLLGIWLDRYIELEKKYLSVVGELAIAKEEINCYELILFDIGDLAHDASTGPAVPDTYWEIREMAYKT